MAAAEEWSVNANEAVQISLVRPGDGELATVQKFHPTFTYPIFGESEQIFGYKGLEIDIKFATHNLQPNVAISYNRKFTAVGTTAALDLNKTFREFLPADAFRRDFDVRLQHDTTVKDWSPPGTLVHNYSKKGEDFEVWAGSLLDPAVRSLVDNIQICILFYIEGGQTLNLDDVDWTLDRWRIYFVYQKSKSPTPNCSPYSFIGYSTTYRFYRIVVPKVRPKTTSITKFPLTEANPTQLPSRLRISQFVILPPYQSSGHGSALYQSIYSEALADETITELTVEDPSEEFDKLRDINDWKILEPELRAAKVRLETSKFANSDRRRIRRVPTGALLATDILETVRINKKIAGRQFARQVEMFLLSLIPFSRRAQGGASLTTVHVKGPKASDPADQSYYWWRILLKQRIMKYNRGKLQQVELEDRIRQIEDTARGQEDEYEALLLIFAVLAQKESERNGNGSSSAAEASGPRKRKVIIDDDDEDSGGATPDSKRARA